MPCTYFLIYVIFGTTFTGQIVCLGNSLSQILDGAQIRQSRSPHQLYRRMCPYGSNRETCFYSQLSMFMRLHNSLDDPVHMRNIGKRSGGGTGSDMADESPLKTLEAYPDMLATTDGLDNQGHTKLLETPYSNDEIMNGDDSQSQLNAQSYGYLSNRFRGMRNANFLSNSLPPWRAVQSQRPNPKVAGINGDESEYVSMPRKRQIICPRGMARMQCYDKALAFYMQLLSTMGDQK